MLPTDLNQYNLFHVELIPQLFSVDSFQAGLIDYFQMQRDPRFSSRNL